MPMTIAFAEAHQNAAVSQLCTLSQCLLVQAVFIVNTHCNNYIFYLPCDV